VGIPIDSGGRILLPKGLRESPDLLPGANTDVSSPGRNTVITDDAMFALIDGGRR
jgi:hypothetical protein